jgi:DNA-directed RNA polymerase specialized sigma subunit
MSPKKRGKVLDGNDVAHFQFFAEQVKDVTHRFTKTGKEEFLKQQEVLVNNLSALEEEFRRGLKTYNRLKEIFDIFYDYITKERRNLLAVQPFFRERSTTFTSVLLDYIKQKNYNKVFEYHINFLFIQFIINHINLSDAPELLEIFEKIKKIRWDLVEMNLPLVISRARIFYSRTPRSHLAFMDLVQIGVGGLLNAIDKFCGKYERMWRGVVVGRITGDEIAFYNDTVMRFYPNQRRTLYRANKFFARNPKEGFNEQELMDRINKDIPESEYMKLEDVRQLLLAAGIVSVDIRPPFDDEQESEDNIALLPASEDGRPDVAVEKQELELLLKESIRKLSIFDQKILRMKGVFG